MAITTVGFHGTVLTMGDRARLKRILYEMGQGVVGVDTTKFIGKGLNQDDRRVLNDILAKFAVGDVSPDLTQFHARSFAPGDRLALLSILTQLQTGGTLPTVEKFGTVTKTGGGSVGQTYTAPAGMTGVQWYKRTMSRPVVDTIIPGATGSTYVATNNEVGFRLVARGMLNGVATKASSLMIVLTPITILESFDTGFTASNGAVVTDTVNKVEGVASQTVTGTGTSGTNPLITRTGVATTYDPATDLGVISYGVRVDKSTERQNNQAYVQLGRAGTYADLLPARPSIGNGRPYGWYFVAGDVSEAPNLVALGAGAYDRRGNTLQQTAAGYATYANRISYDRLAVKSKGVPTVGLTFDDSMLTHLTFMAPLMAQYGMRGTAYISQAMCKGHGAGSMDPTDPIRLALDYGWALCTNGTDADGPMTAAVSMQALVDEWLRVRDWVVSLGASTTDANHLCFPNGALQGDSTGAIPAGVQLPTITCASGDTAVTFVSGTANVAQSGFAIYGGAGFLQDGTTITIAAGGATGTLSKPATGTITAKPAVAFDESGIFYMHKVEDRLKAEGCLSARDASPGLQNTLYTRHGFGSQLYRIPVRFFSGASTFAGMQPYWQEAQLRGSFAGFGVHGVSATPPGSGSIQVDQAVITPAIQEIGTAYMAGLLDVLTIPEIVARDNF